MQYRKRIIDSKIDELMQINGGVLIEGCKWCGKTTTAKQHARSLLEFQDPDRQDEYRQIINTRPSLLLDGEKPRLFDEWQRYPVVWDSVRSDIDRTGEMGQYLLTGSAKPKEDSIMHSGTGRISRVTMRPMSLYESGFSDGKISFADIVAGKDVSASNTTTLEDIANYITWGGWPTIPSITEKLRSGVARNYVNSVIHEEVKYTSGAERNYDRMQAVLKSLARNVSTPVSLTTIEQDVDANFERGISRPTARDYLNTLRKLFVVYDIPATTLAFRSKSAIRTTPKKEFVDPSIAVAALHMTAEDLVRDLNTFGFMFECMVARDLISYVCGNEENIYYYRNADGAEVDFILRTEDDKWGAVEVKLGAGQIDQAAQNLLSFKESVDFDKSGEPAFLMVVTATNVSYRRPDGVYVASVASLKD